MRRAIFLIIVAVIFAGMAAAVLLRALGDNAGGGEQMRGMATPVAAYEVSERTFADIVDALGTANANESVLVTAKISDTISRIRFDSGQRVSAGDILVELRDAEEVAGLSEARASLREAEQELLRIRDLTERGVAPRSRLEEIQANAERARARVLALEARVDDRIIRAPFDGVVGLRAVSLGQLVRPGDVIAQLDDVSIIKLDFTLPERFLAAVTPGMEIAARTSAFPDIEFTGEITQIDSRIDPATRAVIVRAEIDNEEGRLRPGLLMTVEVRRDPRTRPAVPDTAITRLRDQVFVFMIENGEGGQYVSQREITVGGRANGYLEVLSGVEPGDIIVRQGVHRVRDGARVQVREGANGARNGAQAVATASAGAGSAVQ
ncbi:MAG: efflux RND transporter periplasmic adaptor subunit [Oceanicaulis sp.]|uniref:efflux RND transporter periplasmic adaptor subunit n=1 Tax=Glycocaulis sp. TaxID=1969725 RepID=UPI0025BE40BD|nr:efflux RND transporter periplasmic adaptor subunit [Glycocaulis sp.]MCC5981250.1 efflux RND transporter periplasmic adaptor subunit [Oceanicaulis sp.]MCH8521617.1 efflux RND transporter periplasmic adaptor subunit [Glycocaulis sp.]